MSNAFARPHRRYNPLTGEWILVSPQRAQRPWLGAVEKTPLERLPEHDPKCYLCPGNSRANNGPVNPPYTGVFVFDNDFPALLADGPHTTDSRPQTTDDGRRTTEIDHPSSVVRRPSSLMSSAPERGICRVICFSPRHDLTLAELPAAQVRAVVDAWMAQCEELGARDDIAYIQLFENKGEIMGCSNPHPHGQLWANETLPTEPAKEQSGQLAYLRGAGSVESGAWSVERAASHAPRCPLLLDYLDLERREGERILFENDHFTCLVPFWAVWPFETMILPRRHVRRMVETTPAERDALADALRRMTARYDNLFEVSFPYTMGVHQAPYDGEPHEEWQLHLHFFPPLLRSATVRKFMVGYEMLAQPQRDLTPEQAADRLRALPDVRFC